jgi:hypothetical protein
LPSQFHEVSFDLQILLQLPSVFHNLAILCGLPQAHRALEGDVHLNNAIKGIFY